MAACLFLLYLLIGCFCIIRIRFIRKSGLSYQLILFLFLVKVAAGCFLGLVNHYIFHNGTDYDVYNRLGMEEHHILFSDPYRFFTDIFKSNYNKYGEFFASSGSYWNDLRTNIIFKVLAFLNFFSAGNYYINSLFFNFFCFFGHIALYRVFMHSFTGKKWPVIIGCFFLPSFLFFSSGIHKDLIVFTALAIFCYSMYFSLACEFSRKRIFFLVLSFLMILLIRNFIAIILIPFTLAWLISAKYPIYAIKIFTLSIFILLIGVIFLHNIHKADPLVLVTEKQQAFLSLGKGTTFYNNDTLRPDFQSYITAAPKAFRHAFLSPYPGEFHSLMNFFASEIFLYAALFILFIFMPARDEIRCKEFIVFAIFFSFVSFMLSGYISTTAGAIIRYRSIYLPFMITPLLASIQWEKITEFLNIK